MTRSQVGELLASHRVAGTIVHVVMPRVIPRSSVIFPHIWVALLLTGLLACRAQPSRNQSTVPSEVAPGTIVLDVVSEGGRYWQFRATPSSGVVREIDSGRRTSEAWPVPRLATGSVDCSLGGQATSANQRFVAKCFGDVPGEPPQFVVTSVAGKEAVFQWNPVSRRGISAFAWSPNSASVALMTYSERPGMGPIELLWRGAGHPVPHDTFYLDIVDVKNGKTVEYTIRRDVVVGNARILDWVD